ncbi:CocE/NonD family hydrolase [Steroidobacter sp.]|uniref:CocE/NonD family hydrolase n=1 Tax=Steroidobacter sp. TaxID=1978227 RepID=UPI001A505A2A|nr:CocE/NonD family hydrolase [Steroidobacter sp.]MBL8267006.1 CocE/NonD family hydrolase [Steroidobacter sp.]
MKLQKSLLGALVVAALLGSGVSSASQSTTLPSETPENFQSKQSLFDYSRDEVMIPMRDGVKLFTVIWKPKYASGPMPIVITRTPYDAAGRPGYTGRPNSPKATAAVPIPDAPLLEKGYIRVYQDVRGKHGSEGNYVMTLPLRGPLNAGPVDQSTDAYDTIDWLVKNVPGNNGRVGIIGVSYEGWTSLMALFNPHPALKASIPMNAMVDGWIGDDWYHNGALRPFGLEYVYRQTSVKGANEIPFGSRDAYMTYLRAGSANDMAVSRGVDQLPAWKKIADNPAYTSYWQAQAVDKLLERVPVNVPTLIVHGLFDQEDNYGSPAAFEVLQKKGSQHQLVIGPWFHGQQDPWFHTYSGSHLGPLQFNSDTTRYFLYQVMLPFFEQHLRDKAPASPTPKVRAFETGTNEWRSYSQWPASGVATKKIYLQANGSLSFTASSSDKSFDEYVSDPAKPVPYRVQPILPNDSHETTWGQWLVDDQRPFESRPDVLTYATEPLTESVTLAGGIFAELLASTSGQDSDWVVKLIDAYPDETPMNPELGGYQLMVSADILRGRYRESFETAKPIKSNAVLPYRVRMPHANHTFQAGHRIMVQIQSSWFPLYDRNPQTFVPNVAYAPREAYKKATQRIYHGSFVELPVLGGR